MIGEISPGPEGQDEVGSVDAGGRLETRLDVPRRAPGISAAVMAANA
jgi:hypothetical protein